MEHPANIGFRCEKHQKKPDPQYAKKPLKWFIGRYCQLAFPCPRKRKEYMWVLVTAKAEHKGEELRGTLDNDPVYAQIRCGDEVEFSRSEILEVIGGQRLPAVVSPVLENPPCQKKPKPKKSISGQPSVKSARSSTASMNCSSPLASKRPSSQRRKAKAGCE